MTKRCLIPAVVLLPLACSSGSRQQDAGSAGGDAAAIAPEGLSVTALAGGNGVLEVIALTLREGRSSIEIYAALKNIGTVPACHAAFAVELFDDSQQSLVAAIGGLLTQRFYRLSDGSDAIAACVGPGDVSMAALTDLPADIAVEEVRHVIYRCPYFALDVVPIAGLDVSQVSSIAGSGGTECTGTLVNGLDVPVSDPSVTVFSVDRSGRPFNAATASDTGELPPGGRWRFETTVAGPRGADYVAYPAGVLANQAP